MTHQVVGYKRVSSPDQNPDRQLLNIILHKEFIDHTSGCSKDRQGLKDCVEYVRQGDTLVVDSIDRLARNLRDLQELIATLINKGVYVKFIKENLVFSATDDPLSNLTLHMMGAFAEFERSMIRTRQKEGIAAAKKAGKHVGRPFKLNESHKKQAKEMKAQGMSIRKIAMTMEISRMSVYKLLDIYPSNGKIATK